VRFAYDSIYVQIKKKKSIWSIPDEQLDELELSKNYLAKSLRANQRSYKKTAKENTNIDSSIDEHETEQSLFHKFINYIYHSDDNFRFTTMVTCTYTVAFVFLYYLACTFIFLYISRTTGHISFLKYYIESSARVGK
jgi:hypothetical protein